MVSLGISEFTFGYGFLFEQTHANWANLTAAPVLPSLQQEADLGWDAKLPLQGSAFFYQFKLAERLAHGNALYIKNGTYAGPYYRIALHRRDSNRQHRRLRQHALTHPDTYYVAPEMETLDDFNAAFLARTIASKSRLIPVAQCQDYADGNQHHITFKEGEPNWADHSETIRHKRSFFGREVEKLYRDSGKRWHAIDLGFAKTMFEETREFAWEREREEEPIGSETRTSPLLDSKLPNKRDAFLHRTADILAAYLGVTLLLVGEAPTKPGKT
jgi:hypothetical protein